MSLEEGIKLVHKYLTVKGLYFSENKDDNIQKLSAYMDLYYKSANNPKIFDMLEHIDNVHNENKNKIVFLADGKDGTLLSEDRYKPLGEAGETSINEVVNALNIHNIDLSL